MKKALEPESERKKCGRLPYAKTRRMAAMA
jgi:hypothetical protein